MAANYLETHVRMTAGIDPQDLDTATYEVVLA
ncbi:MAG: hypothetical protein JWM61_970, partial [Micrococcaceae bacterium]|nr:hypothetical protein [Micrococcaceae bacterium]